MAKKESRQAADPEPAGKTAAQHQQELLASLGQDREHVEKVQAWFKAEDRHLLLRRYELGRQIDAHFKSQKKNTTGHYGHRFVGKLCDLFGWDKGLVYNARTVFEAFANETIDALATQPMANGRIFPFGHTSGQSPGSPAASRVKSC